MKIILIKIHKDKLCLFVMQIFFSVPFANKQFDIFKTAAIVQRVGVNRLSSSILSTYSKWLHFQMYCTRYYNNCIRMSNFNHMFDISGFFQAIFRTVKQP